MNNGANIYINGAGVGHYTSQSGGQITNSTAGGVITLLGNWVNNSANVGFSNDGATTVLAGANQTIGGGNSTSFYNLTLQGSGTKSLLINTTACGQALFNGVLALNALPLDLNGFRLDVTNSLPGAITNSSGYIISETNVAVNPSIVRWYLRTASGAHVYPFGVSGTQIPFTFNVTSPMPSATGYVDVSTRATATSNNQPWAGVSDVGAVTNMFSAIIGGPGEIPVVIDRWWDITSSNSITADVTFSYRGIENTLSAPYNTGSLGAQHWNGSGWDPPVGSAAAVSSGVGMVTATGLSTFSPWILSSLTTPLPVELLDFSATCSPGKTKLNWSTATEHNTSYFEILKSDDAVNFNSIGKVTAKGNSEMTQHYSFEEEGFRNGSIAYYRLRMVDLDNTSKNSKTIAVDNTCDQDHINLFYNQDKGIVISSVSAAASAGTLNVRDAAGKIVFETEISLEQGSVVKMIRPLELSNGIYFVQLVTATETIGCKIAICQ